MSALSLLPKKIHKMKEGQENTGPFRGSVGVVETRYFHFALPPDELTLENGEKLGPITVA